MSNMISFNEAIRYAVNAIDGLIPIKARHTDDKWYFKLNRPSGSPQLEYDIPIYCVPKNGDTPHEVWVGMEEFVDYQLNARDISIQGGSLH